LYIGNVPGENFISFSKQSFTIVNSQTAYTLDFPVNDGNDIRLVINNVIQEPGGGKAYTAAGNTLTLSEALTNGTDEMYCVFLGKARETVTVPTITKDKVDFISDGTGSGVISKGDGSSIDGSIQLNCHVNSHGIKLKSPPHSAGQSYTLTFPSTAPSAGKVLQTDGSGNLSFANGGIFESQLLHVRDEKSSGTGSGSSSGGSWQTRTLNTVKTNEITSASLSSNQISLPSGTYYIMAKANHFDGDRHKIKLRNITDSSDEIIGSSEYGEDAYNGTTNSYLNGRFTIGGTKVFEIQHRCETSGSFGVA
jgi:hypothetical protein